MTTLQITFVSESAGYRNTLGYYNKRTGEVEIIYLDTNDDGRKPGIEPGDVATIEVDQADLDAGNIGFFIIPNGADLYGTGNKSKLNGPLSFEIDKKGDGHIVDARGRDLKGEQGQVIFSDPALNKKNVDYTKGDDDADGILGRIAFEDLVKKSDRDFNDLVIDVKVVGENAPPAIQNQSFDIDENTAPGTIVDRVVATDPEGAPLSYAIVAGNDGDAFAIDADGNIAVLGGLDYETLSSYTLTVQVTDSGGLSATAEVVIGVNNVLETLEGHALDGYVAGATVFADSDADGVLDAEEVSATTDASGNFTLLDGSGALVMFGGTDVSTGLAFTGVLRAPAGSAVVTPLTTIAAALVDAGQTPAQAAANVAAAFGIGGLGIDILSFDPIPAAASGDAGAAQVLAAGVQVRNAMVQIGALLSGAGVSDAQAAVVSALASLAATGTPVDLTDPVVTQALIESAAAAGGVAPGTIDAVVSDAAQVLAETNAAAADAVSSGGGVEALEALAQAAAVAQGSALANALGQAGAANDPGTLAAEYTGTALESKIAEAPIGDVDGGLVGTPGDDVLVGTPGIDLIDGLAGNDLLQGLEGNDRLLGGEGDDVLEGGVGHDLLRGGAGNDVLNGGIVADAQSDAGLRDTDRADYSTASSGVDVNLATGFASDGDGGTDALTGVESVTGSAFDDVLTGTSTFSENWRGGAGNDTIDGAGGFDRAEYDDATSGIAITVGGFGGFSTSTGSVVGDASVGNDTLANVETFVGSDHADTYVVGLFLSGSLPGGFASTFNSFEGRGGNDIITGNGSTRVDYVSATGAVVVDFALGTATGDVSVGTDTFTGVYEVRATSFDDILLGGNPSLNGFEGFDGRGGNDFIDGGQGWDRADYAFNGPASTGVTVQLAAGIATGDAQFHGTDTLRGIEAVRGSHLADVFDATGFSDASVNAGWFGTLNEFQGMAGDDTIIGNGNTRLAYGLSRESITADLALGTVVGGASVGIDTIVGGVSEVFGTNFDDTLRGGSGNEILRGFSGNDLLVGGAGSDLLDGGFGIDRADYSSSAGGVFVDLLFNTANDGLGGTDTLFGVEEVVGTGFNDTLYGDWMDNLLVGGMGHDVLRGGGGNDVLDGGIVADFQSDAGFRDTDRADYSAAFMGVVVDLAAGTAQDGEGGTDTLSGFEGVTGSMFNDSITGSDAFSQFFRGGAGDDFIDGGGGNDQAEYWDATSGITVNLGFAGDASGIVAGDFSVGFDTLLNVERIVGSDHADGYFVGAFLSASGPGGAASTFNSFEGRGGNDSIVGNFGTRIEFVGATSGVVVDFELGQATGDASVGTDTFSGVSQVRGSSFADTFIGSNFFSDETFDGRGGDDYMDGRLGFDRADYAFNGPSSVGIAVNLAAGTATGDPVFTGSDTLRSIESVRGSHLDDVYDARGFSGGSINAGSFNTLNEFEGMAGDDTVWGNGNTRLTFANAREGVEVDLAAGTVTGGASVGNDILMGGINVMRGSAFDDVLMGSNHGITSAEVYEGRRGNDTYSGRGGFDQAQYIGDPTAAGITVAMASVNEFTGTVTGDDAIGTDTLIDIVSVLGTRFNDTYDATGYFSAVSGLGAFNEFDGNAGNDTITGNGATRVSYLSTSSVTVDLAAGTASGLGSDNDTLINIFNVRGSNADDTLFGSASSDTFEGRGGFDFIDGREGFDLVRYDNGSNGAGTFVSDAIGTFTATAGGHNTDTLVNIESIRGTNFGDAFDGSASVLGFTFDARGGDDTLVGSQGGDSLLGGDGNDLLRGGLGADFLDGGTGADRFDFDHLDEAGDSIAGFDGAPGGDVLDVGELLANSTNYASGADGAATDYVRIEASGTDGLLQIDADGAGGPAAWQTLALILGGAGLNAGTLLAQGSLDVEADVVSGITVIGTPGNDVLSGSIGDDTLIALLGHDLLIGGAGNDLLDGGIVADFQSDAGFRDTDRADYSTAFMGVVVDLAAGTAQDGEGGTDSLIGVEGVIGSAHDDVLTGGSDAFVEYFRGGAGNDTIDGGNWNDRAEYMDATGGITVNLAALAPNMGTVTGDASVGSDTLANVEIVYGTDFADSYSAIGFLSAGQPGGLLSNFNAFEGRGGDDTIIGNGGTRIEYTGATAGISVDLTAGVASGDASVGTDTFSGVNSVRGSSFADTLLGGSSTVGTQIFDGRGGNDYIEGGVGFDVAAYAFDGPISTGIVVNLAEGTVTGDAILTGTDTLRGIESLQGSHLDDWYDATGYSASSPNAGWFGTYNEFQGMAGNDTITGNGNTRILYGAAREGVSVNLAAGTAVGGASVGIDTILGGVWAVRGSNFNDLLVGSAASEYFEGRAGDDVIDGGGGFDTAAYDVGASGGGTFIANASGGMTATAAGLGADILSGIESIIGTNFDDYFDGSAASIGYSVDGRNGNDTLIGSQGSDFLNGGIGDDTLSGGAGDDFVDGGAGNDIVDGGDGFDQAHYEFSANSSGSFIADSLGAIAASGGTGSDTLTNVEWITGTAFGDQFDASAATIGYSFDGYLGDDTLVGSQGGDSLFGGDGNDLLRGGLGSDFLDGGAGADRFDFDFPWDGTDTIANFLTGSGNDVIDLADLMINWTTYEGGLGGALQDFVRIDSLGFDGLLQVDPDGVTGPQGWQDLAILLGTGALNVTTLLIDGNLDVGPTGGSGGITLVGTSGNDFLPGTPGDDTISGLLGNDFLIGLGGNDLLDGGIIADLQSDDGFRDNDRIDYSQAPSGVNVNLRTSTAADGYGGTDTLIGIEAVTGSMFNDTIVGSNTTFSESFRGGAGDDFIDGGGGNDQSEYADATNAVSIFLGFGGAGSVSGDLSVGFDTLLGVERFQGSSFADTYDAGGFNGGFNSFEGRGGDDQIFGNWATRIEFTGATSGVVVDIDLGQATGDASVGTDTFSGVTQARGSSHADTFLGATFFSDETFDGRGGNDFMDGRLGTDRADYAFNGPVAFGISVDLAGGTVVGDPTFTGTDTLRSIEAIRGSHKDDLYDARGFSGASTNAGSFGTLNEFEGMAGNDTVWGNGNTRLTFGNAREGVSVDLAAGTVTGGASVGNDTLMGGVNQMRGSSFDDLFEGTNHGITFAEVYEGRAGNDTYSGRGGFDQARYDSDPTAAGITVVMAAIDADTGMVTGDAAIGTDTLTDIVGVVGTWFDDVYDGTGYFSAVSGLAAFNEFEGLGGNDHITGNGSTRVSYISSWDGVTVDLAAGTASSMGAGIDTLVNVFNVRGSNNADTLLGGFGADTFEGRGGDDFIDGSAGNDLVRYDNGSSGGGTFIANAMGGFTAIAPGHGTDTLVNVEQIRGSNFADSFDGSARVLAFTFDGRGGNDTIVGTQDGDDLRGGDGNDWLRGGLGADMLRGEAGSDTFDYDLLAEGGDTLLDFQAGPGGDVIDIADLLAASTGYNGGLGGPLENFVRVDGTGPHSLLQVDADGGLPSWTTVATMLNVPGLNLATMIADGNLDTLI